MKFSAGGVRASGRLFAWAFALLYFVLGNLFDRIFLPEQRKERSRRQRAALRLRRALERVGGAAIKIGQQAAMRLDILPYEYANELSRMLDKVPPFPTWEAIELIEAAAKQPLHELYQAFDPEPIGAASVSCVYQAVRQDGRAVAVKVRRPGIGRLFMADTKALELIFRWAEALSLVRPGLTKNVIVEFRAMLLDELDFVKEARNAELFRRSTKKCKLHFVTAPKVHFDYSSEAVLVTDFVQGIWLSEMITAVEQKDANLLSVLERLRIEPKRVAKRMLEVNQFTTAESILFHADPHPGNIVVHPDSKLVFIDFGACGAYTERERHAWRRLLESQLREDVGEMVQCSLAILEPLPPIDIEEFARKLESVFWQDLYAFRSKHAEWWERTSAHIWISFLGLANEYKIPMNLNTLRMIRSTLLYDTIAARLDKKIDAYLIYERYLKKAGARARKRIVRRVDRTLIEGPPNAFWLRAERFVGLVEKAIYLAHRTLDDPPYRLASQIAKAAYAVQMGIKTTFVVGTLAAAWVSYHLVDAAFFTEATSRDVLGNALWALSENRWFWLVVALIVTMNLRKVTFRLLDKEANQMVRPR